MTSDTDQRQDQPSTASQKPARAPSLENIRVRRISTNHKLSRTAASSEQGNQAADDDLSSASLTQLISKAEDEVLGAALVESDANADADGDLPREISFVYRVTGLGPAPRGRSAAAHNFLRMAVMAFPFV